MLLSLADELEAQGTEIRLIVEPQSRVARTLRLLRIFERFQTVTGLDAALGCAEQAPETGARKAS